MKWNRMKLHRWIIGLLVIFSSFLPTRGVEAADAWTVAAEALGVLAAYQSSLASVLSIGNDVNAQVSGRVQDEQQNGMDPNEHDQAVVRRVMTKLINQGEYELQVNSLPFTYFVNDDPMFNAACYPTNYISINRGLVRGLNCDEDELAAVLAHEMTHGIEQHSAKNYAKAMAQYVGLSLLNMETGATDWNRLNGIVNYSIAKNVTLPTEYEADAGGFYLMTSAGFNPGGPAAAMARMSHYVKYETTDIWEYDAQDTKPNEENFSDHPETDKREQRLAAMMTEYGCGHVTVENRRNVLIDGNLVYTSAMTSDDYDNRTENAYYVAGALAKAFHDYDSAEEWNFRKGADGRDDLLTEDHSYAVLREYIRRTSGREKLYGIVAAAYAGEAASGARIRQREQEAARRAEWEKRRQAALAAKVNADRKLYLNADTYSDYGMGDYALMEISRYFASQQQENLPEAYGIRGRAKAICGDFEGGLRDAAQALEMDATNPYNFLNRADIYHMQGDYALALQDVASALALDGKNAAAYFMQGMLRDELADHDGALESYRSCYELTKNPEIVPMAYLKEIDAEKAGQLEKGQAQQEEERLTQWKKQKESKKNKTDQTKIST